MSSRLFRLVPFARRFNITAQNDGSSGCGGTGLNWNQVHAAGTPPAPRHGHAAGYDPASNRMIVFGGAVGQTTCANDLWVLTNANGFGGNASWTQLTFSGGPPAPRWESGGVYDPTSNTLMIYGGDNCNNAPFSDYWVLSNANGVGATPTWTQLSPTGGPGVRLTIPRAS